MMFEVYRARNKQWAWRLRADNGEIVASGETYKRRVDCYKAINLIKVYAMFADVMGPKRK